MKGGSMKGGAMKGVLWNAFLSFLVSRAIVPDVLTARSWTLNQSGTTISQAFQPVLLIYIKNLWCLVTGATN